MTDIAALIADLRAKAEKASRQDLSIGESDGATYLLKQSVTPSTILSLISALEEAQRERDGAAAVGREPWGWACWFGDTNTLRDPNILRNYSEDNAREALRRIEHPEWHVVTLYERPS